MFPLSVGKEILLYKLTTNSRGVTTYRDEFGRKTDTKDEQKDKKYIRREFSYSKFEQRLALPDNVEKQNIAAQMNDGVLIIDIPKMTLEEKAQECHYIEIK